MEDKWDVNEREYRAEILALIRGEDSPKQLRAALERYHDNDIAAVLEELTESEHDRLRAALGNEAMSDVVSYLEDTASYFSAMEADEAADIIEQMDADEALEALENLDEETRDEVLSLIEDETVREEIALLDSYDDDAFGAWMSTNFIAITRGETVKGAMKALVAQAAENDNISTIFVTDESGRFYGAIDLHELIVARSERPLEELICTTFPFVYDRESVSESTERLRGYSEDLIPVLCAESGVLLGVITAQDIIDIVDEELGDDYAKLAALGSAEQERESLLGSMKKRVPWLVVLLLMGLAVSAVVGAFEGVVKELPMIVAFQSLILGMAGNVGTQSLAVTVRALGMEESGTRRRLRLVARETRVAFCNGLALGLVSAFIVGVYLGLVGSYGVTFVASAALCVGGAMCFAMTISGFTGAAIPITLHRIGVDPAVASGPLITTVNDLVAVVSYYGLALALLLPLCA